MFLRHSAPAFLVMKWKETRFRKNASPQLIIHPDKILLGPVTVHHGQFAG